MSTKFSLTMPVLNVKGHQVPEGFQLDPDVQVEWWSTLRLNLLSTKYQSVTFYKGEKAVTLSWEEVEKRLGIEW